MSLLDIFYPKYCLNCRAKGQYLCQACTVNLQKTYRPPPKNIDKLVTIWKYDGAIRKGILALKYRFATQIAQEIAALASKELQNYRLPPKSIMLPIPLHKKRQNWRGFNQAEVIAKMLATNLNISYSDNILMRKTHSTPQAQLSREKRLQNISGKYAVNIKYLSKIHQTGPIILFDDVMTTGATLSEAASELKKAGVKEIWALVLAA